MGQFKQCLIKKNLKLQLQLQLEQNCAQAEDYKKLLDSAQFWFFFLFTSLYYMF